MKRPKDERISIWSVPARLLPVYYVAFTVLFAGAVVVAILATEADTSLATGEDTNSDTEEDTRTTTHWHQWIIGVAGRTAQASVASVAIIVLGMEVIGVVGVAASAFSEYLRERKARRRPWNEDVNRVADALVRVRGPQTKKGMAPVVYLSTNKKRELLEVRSSGIYKIGKSGKILVGKIGNDGRLHVVGSSKEKENKKSKKSKFRKIVNT